MGCAQVRLAWIDDLQQWFFFSKTKPEYWAPDLDAGADYMKRLGRSGVAVVVVEPSLALIRNAKSVWKARSQWAGLNGVSCPCRRK